MRRGKCPKCGSASIHSKIDATAYGSIRGIQVYANKIHWATTTTYICIKCGYYEHFISDPQVLIDVEKDWPKVPTK